MNHTSPTPRTDLRPADEIEAWQRKDPIPRLAGLLEASGFTRAGFEAMDAEVMSTLEAAVAFSKASPFPPLSAALEDVYADPA